MWIDLAVRALEVRVGYDSGPAVAGAGDVNHVEVVFLDDPVEVHVNEVLPGGCAPVSQQHVLHIRERQRPLQQRVVVQINLADRQIVGGAPVGIHPVEQFRRECAGCHNVEPRLRTRGTVRAIMSSSSVRMTRTVARLTSAEITPAVAALRDSFSSMPRKLSPSQMRARTSGAFSPMPPAKTSVSNPPTAAAKDPFPFLT